MRFVVLMAACIAALLGCGDERSSSRNFMENTDALTPSWPLVFVARPLTDATDNVFEPTAFNPGARLILKSRAVHGAAEIDLLANIVPAGRAYDVKDLSGNAAGDTLLFSLKLEPTDDDEETHWDIYRYELEQGRISPVIQSPLQARRGDDLAPAFLADGRIVFSSNRQQTSRARLLDDGKPQYQGLTERGNQPAFNLHVMRADGTDIEQLTFNPSHDLDPRVLSDGRIVFLRWDALGPHNQLSLYSVRADGSELNRLYGFESQTTGSAATAAYWSRVTELDDGRLVAVLKSREAPRLGGDLVAFDAAYTAEAADAQMSLAIAPVDTTASGPSLGGHFHSAAPLGDGSGRILVSHSPCRVRLERGIAPCLPEHLAAGAAEAPALYGIWMLDPALPEMRPVKVPEEGMMFVEPTLLKPRPGPTYFPPTTPVTELAEAHLGAVVIGDVFALDGNRPAMASTASMLRLYKHVPLPPDEVFEVENAAFGRADVLRELIGYVPIEADGSVRFAAPADLAFGFELIDANFNRVSTRHDIWLQVRPGEVKVCAGCHAPGSDNPHGRLDLEQALLPEIAGGGISVTDFTLPSIDPPVAAAVRYVDVATELTDASSCPPLDPPPPAWNPPSDCYISDWDARCYASFDYRLHIQPLWEADRRSCDDSEAEQSDRTCVMCHRTVGETGARVPDGQLDLTASASDTRPDFITSYVELLFGNNEQEVVEGSLQDRLILTPTGQPLLDANGEPVLDENGQPEEIILSKTVPVPLLLGPAGAGASADFFEKFAEGGSHAGDLSAAELRLLAEWLDLGGQYFNDPFTTIE